MLLDAFNEIQKLPAAGSKSLAASLVAYGQFMTALGAARG